MRAQYPLNVWGDGSLTTSPKHTFYRCYALPAIVGILRLLLWAEMWWVHLMKPHSSLILAALVGLFSVVRAGTITFNDSFNGSSLNTSNWTPSTPFSDSSAAVSGGNLVLNNRGRVLTTNGFSDPVDMLLAFQFTGSQYDSFHIVLRTDGSSNNAPGEFDNGIFATFRMKSDTGDTSNNVSLFSQQNPTGTQLGAGTFAMTEDQTYLIRILDTGSMINLFINDLSTPFLTAYTTDSYGSQIGLDNREGAGAGSGISAGSQVSIDFFSVTSKVPELGVTALYLGLSIVALMLVMRWNAKVLT